MSLACAGAAKSAFSAIGAPISAATATARSTSWQRSEAATGIPCVASRASASASDSQPPAGSRSSTEAITARAADPSRPGYCGNSPSGRDSHSRRSAARASTAAHDSGNR